MIEALLMGAAMGATIKSIQHMRPGLVSPDVNVTLQTPVDVSKTIVLWSQSTGSDHKALGTCELINSDTVRVTRDNMYTNFYSNIIVVEFNHGVSVQRGTVGIDDGSFSSVDAISAVDKAKSLIFGSARSLGYSSNFGDVLTTVQLETGQQVKVKRDSGNGGIFVHWQVLEFI